MFDGSLGNSNIIKSRGNKQKFYLKTVLCIQSHFLENNYNK